MNDSKALAFYGSRQESETRHWGWSAQRQSESSCGCGLAGPPTARHAVRMREENTLRCVTACNPHL